MFENIKLIWVDNLPPDNIEYVEFKIREDIGRSLKSLLKPSRLIFHFVFLGETLDDENVMVWGKEGDDDNFYCTWYDTAKWESI